MIQNKILKKKSCLKNTPPTMLVPILTDMGTIFKEGYNQTYLIIRKVKK